MTSGVRRVFGDRYTGGEPTRIVVRAVLLWAAARWPCNTSGFASTATRFAQPWSTGLAAETHGWRLLCEPRIPGARRGCFFNNVGYLNMCGHNDRCGGGGSRPGRITRIHRFERPSAVAVTLEDANHAAIDNVASYRTTQWPSKFPASGGSSATSPGAATGFLVAQHDESMPWPMSTPHGLCLADQAAFRPRAFAARRWRDRPHRVVRSTFDRRHDGKNFVFPGRTTTILRRAAPAPAESRASSPTANSAQRGMWRQNVSAVFEAAHLLTAGCIRGFVDRHVSGSTLP